MYETINGTLVGNNLMEIFIYNNSVTHNQFINFVLLAFFLVVLIGSIMAQLRFTARVKPDTSFLAASFATFALALILAQYPGLVSAVQFVVLFIMIVIGFIWVALDD